MAAWCFWPVLSLVALARHAACQTIRGGKGACRVLGVPGPGWGPQVNEFWTCELRLTWL